MAPPVVGRLGIIGGVNLGALAGGPVVLAAAAMAQGLATAISAIKGVARAFAEDLDFSEVARGFEGLAGGADRASKLMAAMRRGSSSLVAARDLTQLGARAMQAGVADNEERLQKILRAGHLLGRAVGVGIVEATGKLIDSLARGSARTLGELGISTAQLRDAMEQAAARAGTTVAEMERGDRIRLQQQVAIDLAAERAEQFATSMVDVSDVTAQAAALFDDLRLRITLAIARSPEAIAVARFTAQLFSQGVERLREVEWDRLARIIRETWARFLPVMRLSPAFRAIEALARRGPDVALQDLDTFLVEATEGPIRRLEQAWEARNEAVEFWSDRLATAYLWMFGDDRSLAEHRRMVREGTYRAEARPRLGDVLRQPIRSLRSQLRSLRFIISGDPDLAPQTIPADVRRGPSGGIDPPASLALPNAGRTIQTAAFRAAKRWRGVIEKEIQPAQEAIAALGGAFGTLANELERAAGKESAVGRLIKRVRLGITALISWIQAAINLARAIAELLSFNYVAAAAHFLAAATFATAGSLAIALGGEDRGGRSAFARARAEAAQAVEPTRRRVTAITVNVPGDWHEDDRRLESEVLRQVGAAVANG